MKKNILVLVVDCLRADHVDVNSKINKNLTPFLKNFSKNGVCFEKIITQSSWTKTSVASILTGTNPFTHGVHNILDKISANLNTIPEIFKKNGYLTGYFTSNPYLAEDTGYERGFKIKNIIQNDDGTALNDDIKKEIDAVNEKSPFFFYVQYMDPHQPYKIHSTIRKKLKQKIMNKYDTGLKSSGKVSISDRDLEILKDLYSEEVKYSDQVIRNLISNIKARGILEDTLVIITADHGIELMEHGGLYHSAKLYNELTQVPLIIVGPDIYENKFLKGQIRSIDIMPTLLDYSNIEIPNYVQGESVLPYLKSSDMDELNLKAYSERNRTHEQIKLRSLIDGNWKIIRHEKLSSPIKSGISSLISHFKNQNYEMVKGSIKAGKNYLKRKIKNIYQKSSSNSRNNVELFNLEDDKEEKRNLASEMKQKRKKMENELNKYIKEGKEKYKSKDKANIDKKTKERLKSLGYLD